MHRFASLLRNTATRFAAEEKGTFAVTLGLTTMAVMLCAGVAVDYTRLAMAKTALAESLDAAVLAAGSELATGENNIGRLEATFEGFLETNLQTRGYGSRDYTVVNFEADPSTGKVSAEATGNVKMAFMGLAGHNSADVHSVSEAVFSSADIEISMVLDVTGSMQGSKIRDLRSAASDAVKILLPANRAKNNVRIGLVPYSWSVNAGPYASRVTGNASSRCVTERGGQAAFNDAGLQSGLVGADVRAVAGDLCPQQEILPLTSDRQALVRDINRLRADGWTAGHIGIAWGYYMLSQNWAPVWPAQSRPADYDKPVTKIAIVMTDGEFNTYYDGVSGTPFGTQANRSGNAARQLCRDMKTEKAGGEPIIVYTIAFDAPASAQAVLQDCASPAEGNRNFYYSAKNGAELREAFRSIALDISKLRLVR
jgi:Flp pilus assembly protein TadG